MIHKHIHQTSKQFRGETKRKVSKATSALMQLNEYQAIADDWRTDNLDFVEEFCQVQLRMGMIMKADNAFNDSETCAEPVADAKSFRPSADKRGVWTKRKTDTQENTINLENQTDMLRSPYSKHFQFFQDPSPLDRLEMKSFVNQESLRGDLNLEEGKITNQTRQREDNEMEQLHLLRKYDSSACLDIKTNPTATNKTKKIEYMFDGSFDTRKNYRIYFPYNNCDEVLRTFFPRQMERQRQLTKKKPSRKNLSVSQRVLSKKNIIVKLTSFERRINQDN